MNVVVPHASSVASDAVAAEAVDDRVISTLEFIEDDDWLTQDAPAGERTVHDIVTGWVDDYSEELLRTSFLILRSSEAAEDCVQEAYIRAYKAVQRLEPIDNPRAWLYRVTSNIALNVLRSRRREASASGRIPTPVDVGTEGAQRVPVVGHGDDALLDRQVVAAALNELPEVLRAMIVLRYYSGLTDSEIGASVGVSAGTVKSRLNRARKFLSQSAHLRDIQWGSE